MPTWKRTYAAVFFANLVTAVGMMSFLPFFPSYLAELGLDDRDSIEAWTGLVFGAAPLAAALMGPIWGSIGDRYGRKLMVLRALLAISLFVGGMSLVRTPLQLLILRVGQGVFSGFVPPSITLVSVGAPRAVQGRIAATLQVSLAAGSIVGPLAGSWIRGAFGLRSVFVFVALASSLAALAVALFAREDADLRVSFERFSPTAVLAGTWHDLRSSFTNARLRAAVLLLFVVQFGVGATNPLLELYVRDLGPASEDVVVRRTALLFTVLALATLIATPWWGRHGDRVGHGRALRRGSLACVLALVAHALAPVFRALLGARVLLGFGAAGANASAFGTATTETAPERRGNAVGAVFSARALAVSLGAVSGGQLSSRFGIPALFWGGAAVLLVALFLTRRAAVSAARS